MTIPIFFRFLLQQQVNPTDGQKLRRATTALVQISTPAAQPQPLRSSSFDRSPPLPPPPSRFLQHKSSSTSSVPSSPAMRCRGSASQDEKQSHYHVLQKEVPFHRISKQPKGSASHSDYNHYQVLERPQHSNTDPNNYHILEPAPKGRKSDSKQDYQVLEPPKLHPDSNHYHILESDQEQKEKYHTLEPNATTSRKQAPIQDQMHSHCLASEPSKEPDSDQECHHYQILEHPEQSSDLNSNNYHVLEQPPKRKQSDRNYHHYHEIMEKTKTSDPDSNHYHILEREKDKWSISKQNCHSLEPKFTTTSSTLMHHYDTVA